MFKNDKRKSSVIFATKIKESGKKFLDKTKDKYLAKNVSKWQMVSIWHHIYLKNKKRVKTCAMYKKRQNMCVVQKQTTYDTSLASLAGPISERVVNPVAL